MKATVYYGPQDVRVEEVDDPKVVDATDAIVRVTYTCVCGSDLWYYRGQAERDKGGGIGHELMGVVEAVGTDVKNVHVGDNVVCPFSMGDGTCPECKAGAFNACRHREMFGSSGFPGAQSQKARIAYADANLFVIPKDTISEDDAKRLLPLSDVLSTGHHAAVCGRVGDGSTVAVVGDGAVGLCAVAASKRLGAKKIILLSTHEDRALVGRQFGATDIVNKRGDEAVAAVKDLTGDLGADCVLECVGTPDSWSTALGAVRAGGDIGFVGLPFGVSDIPVRQLFSTLVGIKGSGAPVAAYIPELLPDVLSGKLDVSAIFSADFTLEDMPKAYAAMDERRAIKSFVKV